MPGPHSPQLGFHRSRVRAGFPEDREGRAAASVGRVSGRHAVPDARRRPAAGADRHRPGRARSARPRRGAAAPRPASSRSAAVRAAEELLRSDDPRVPGPQRHRQRRRPGHARSRGAAHASAARQRVDRGLCLVPLAHVVECRADQQVVLDENFIPTVLQVRAATPAGDGHHGAARAVPSARRSARRAGRGDRTGRGLGARRLPDAAGHQPVRAGAGALRRHRRASIPSSSTSSVWRRPASWRRSRPRPSVRRSFRDTGTTASRSPSSRSSSRCASR